MTAPWSPADAIRDTSDQYAAAADDALGEVMAGRDEWADDDRPTKNELARDEWDTDRYRSWTDEH